MIKTKSLLCHFQKRNHLHLKIKVCWDQLSVLEFFLFLHATDNIASETINVLSGRILGNSYQQEKSGDWAQKNEQKPKEAR